MTRPWPLKREAQRAKVGPACLVGDDLSTCLGFNPAGHFGTAPQSAVGRSLLQCIEKPTALLFIQKWFPAIVFDAIADALRTVLVVATYNLPDPIGLEASCGCHILGGLAASSQPQDLPVCFDSCINAAMEAVP